MRKQLRALFRGSLKRIVLAAEFKIMEEWLSIGNKKRTIRKKYFIVIFLRVIILF